jgi:hypothetical protein
MLDEIPGITPGSCDVESIEYSYGATERVRRSLVFGKIAAEGPVLWNLQ